jgi:predicted PurR-regulated permease PerM
MGNDPAAQRSTTPSGQSPLVTTALCLVTAAASWYLLQQLAGILRPLLLAVFLVYVVLPMQKLLQAPIHGIGSFVIAAIAVVALGSMCLSLYSGAIEMSHELPRLSKQGVDALDRWRLSLIGYFPWLSGMLPDPDLLEARLKEQIEALGKSFLSFVADSLSAAAVVAVYLLFLLLEVRGLPGRLREAFAGRNAESVVAIATRIHLATAEFLRAKVKASLVLAVPVTLVLWIFGVKFPIFFGVLTFALNFIPYVGSLIAGTLPVLLAFLDLDPVWKPIAVTILLITIHTVTGNWIEPAMMGKAVGLRPVVVLLALAFWGECWGLTGMLLAVPLTAILKIVFETIDGTRPIARLMSE